MGLEYTLLLWNTIVTVLVLLVMRHQARTDHTSNHLNKIYNEFREDIVEALIMARRHREFREFIEAAGGLEELDKLGKRAEPSTMRPGPLDT